MPTAEQFAEFFAAVHGYSPFPWQERLLHQVVATNTWPESITAPTGAGKTAVIDVAVFALACGANVPRRVAMVVDRRLVVDAAFEQATRIAHRLGSAGADDPSILSEVARALRRLGGDTPLRAVRLRGGMYREPAWISDPTQPAVICSTIDQVGSRILHQGYGVSAGMRPVHAGLLGNDTLIILDEAHIGEPFRQTIRWIAKLRNVAESPLALPFSFVTMTATPSASEKTSFQIAEEDYSHPVLAARLEARKMLEMRTARRNRLADALAAAALERAEAGLTILVVTNRVATARNVAELVQQRSPQSESSQPEVMVLTGRSRPIDRQSEIEQRRGRLFSGRDRRSSAAKPPLIVVATQTIEVGADLDADALVTEACPLDALIQRVGRLDRLGQRGESAVIMIAEETLDFKDVDSLWEPVYGTQTALTWKWFRSQLGNIDLGYSGWARLSAAVPKEELAALASEKLDAPVLFPAYCDLWVQTRPGADKVPAPRYFLHGREKVQTDVQIVWRADLAEDREHTWIDCIAVVPPSPSEALPIPIGTAKTWLAGEPAAETSDIESATVQDSRRRSRESTSPSASFVIWRGPEESLKTDDTRLIAPGDTIVVPAERGGADRWGWYGTTGQNVDSVADVAEMAHFEHGRTPVIRLHPHLFHLPAVHELPDSEDTADQSQLRDRLYEALESLRHSGDTADQIQTVAAMLMKEGFREALHPSGMGWVLYGLGGREQGSGLSTESEIPQETSQPITLSTHLEAVRKTAKTFAQHADLPEQVVQAIETAASFHDLER